MKYNMLGGLEEPLSFTLALVQKIGYIQTLYDQYRERSNHRCSLVIETDLLLNFQ